MNMDSDLISLIRVVKQNWKLSIINKKQILLRVALNLVNDDFNLRHYYIS